MSHPIETDPGVERLVLFTDAVVAIAITLLVLELKLPHLPEHASDAALREALLDMAGHFVSYVTTFAVIGLFWIFHHQKFRFLRGCDVRLLWLNTAFLMGIAFLPFTSALSAEHGRPITWTLYAGTLAFVGVMAAATWGYAVRAGFVDPAMPEAARRAGVTGPLAMAGVFLLSIACVYLVPPAAPWTFLLLAALAFRSRLLGGAPPQSSSDDIQV